jgi:hypothetical protein
MILFDHIIQVFDLMDDDVGTVGLVIAGDGGFIGLTAVNGDDFGHPVTADRLRQKPQRRLGIPVLCQQNVTGRPGWIHGAIQIALLAFDPDVRLVHAPADPHRPLALVERLFQWGTIRQDPAVDRRVVHGHAALRHQCFNMSITQGYATYQRTHVRIISCGKWAPWKRIMVSPPCPRPESSQREIIRQRRPQEKLATKPFFLAFLVARLVTLYRSEED